MSKLRLSRGVTRDLEDFAQLSGASRNTKYESSMEKVAAVIRDFCTSPAVENKKLFERTLFSFLIGNEDMHLKNFSLIVRDEKAELSPAYDLLNSTIVLAAPKEELALPIRGRKSNLTKNDLFKYFATEVLELSTGSIEDVSARFKVALPRWKELIEISFLPEQLKAKYRNILLSRLKRVGLE